MTLSRLKVPAFETEAEEVAWWEANRELVSEEFAKAGREGRLWFRSEVSGESPRKSGLQLTDEELLRVHEAARRRGITFGQYLTLAVHEALEREPAA